MMIMQKRIAILLALLLALAPTAMSCAKDEETMQPDTSSGTDTVSSTEQTAETDADPYAGYDFGGATLSIFSSADSFDSTNANFLIAGSGEMNGELVNDAVNNRNRGRFERKARLHAGRLDVQRHCSRRMGTDDAACHGL